MDNFVRIVKKSIRQIVAWRLRHTNTTNNRNVYIVKLCSHWASVLTVALTFLDCSRGVEFMCGLQWKLQWKPVADPRFPRGGCAKCKGGGANLLFLPIFAKNCMKLKKFGPRGGARVPGAPPWIRQWKRSHLLVAKQPKFTETSTPLSPLNFWH